jgi:hypothetical protein
MADATDTDHAADRNLLFGVLALQADLLDNDRFTEACSARAARRDARPGAGRREDPFPGAPVPPRQVDLPGHRHPDRVARVDARAGVSGS